MQEARYYWSSALLSDAGLSRRTNEDACLDAPGQGMWAVADGMGGHACGEVASSLVIAALHEISPTQSLDQYVTAVRQKLLAVNRQLRTMAGLQKVAIIGSTVVTLFACGDRCAVLWAGDSRAYLLRSGVLRQLTNDHSQHARRLLPDQPPVDGRMSLSGGNAITRAVGATDNLVIDEIRLPVADGDIYLLCSDGLTNEVSNAEIVSALLPGNCRQAAQSLIARALENGGRDNVSVVVLAVEDLCSADLTVLNPAC